MRFFWWWTALIGLVLAVGTEQGKRFDAVYRGADRGCGHPGDAQGRLVLRDASRLRKSLHALVKSQEFKHDEAAPLSQSCNSNNEVMERELVLRGGGDYRKSWKSMVGEQEIPYSIMGSPMTPDEETLRIRRKLAEMQIGDEEQDQEALKEFQKPIDPYLPVPRPPPGPNGTYGKPDLTGD